MVASTLPPEAEIPGLVLGPDSLSWQLASDVRLYLAAGTALLLQVAHPAVGAGVHDYSTFEQDPWGRLLRTIDYVNLSVYGGREAASAGRRLRDLHREIKGVMPDGRRYHALEPNAYAWVHATLIWSFVEAHARFGRPLPADRLGDFYREFLGIGRLVGVRERDLPSDWPAFCEYFDEMVETRLEHNETVDRVLRSLTDVQRPPLPLVTDRLWRVLRVPPARALRLATVGLLPPLLRERFGLRWTALNDAELRAVGAASRSLTPILPRRLRIAGPAYLRWRAEAIAHGPLGSDRPAAPSAGVHAA